MTEREYTGKTGAPQESAEPSVNYDILEKRMRALLSKQRYFVTNLANASALLYEVLPRLNWAGFYLMREGALVLGPFQGKPACTRIEIGKGVCGTAVREDKVQRIADVHSFPGHIACDSASDSEIVLPLRRNGKVVGVLDIDSPFLNHFDEADEAGLLQIVKAIEETTDLPDA